MREKVLPCFLGLALGAATFAAKAFTTGSVPADGVYKFTFGVSETQDGSIPVPASAVCDVNGTYTDTFSYGFLGTTGTSYLDDVPSNLKSVPHAIDGFKVVKGQKIVLHDTNDVNSVSCVCGPAASEYLPAGASSYEGRYPIRFAARMPDRGYYAVTCTVANASSTADADVTLFSERCHTHAQHLTLAPGDTKTFAWSVELAPNVFKNQGTYTDNAINVVVVGENAALASVTVTKQPTTNENATVNGTEQESINVGKTMWLCDDSTGTDQRCDTPYFALQNYAGTGSGLSRWAPADLSIRNQGEGGLNSSDNAHFDSCLLKPGDYLYVQYGHNEGGTESFTNNLEKYLTRANNAGAYLIIVSPIERHYSWDSANNQWSRTLQGYAEAGKAWVEAKIANGATNVAFLDLNERYSTWMNQEIVRINGINSAISLEKAIDFYYMSAKGGSVDKAHPNNAGADVGAYCVWQEALAVFAAGENAEEDSSAKIQADVVSGIINGVAAKVASDTPWYVDDATIAAGAAPNALWDYAVRAGYDYINSAAVAAVDATVSEGVATISGISMRVMNQINYAKAVIDIVSEDETTTNRWYSYCNYDASGSTSGDIVVPEAVGFLSADLDKDVATTSSPEYSATLTIPDGAKAYIHFAEADGGTWQVGENPAISAVYPFEAWTQVLLDDDCSATGTWTSLFGGTKTFEVPDGESYISFSMTGYDDGGTNKKNGGFAKAFADSASVSSGRIRISFKALYTQGTLRFALSSSAGTTTTPMDTGDVIATLNGSAAVRGSSANVTLSADDTPVAQSTINSDEWMDVDMIIDLDAGKVLASIGGSDYESYSLGALSKTSWSYFGVTLESTKAHAGAIDDVKILSLSPSPKYTIEAAANNSRFGSVEINGAAGESIEAVEGSDVTLAAVSADDTLYRFLRWKDANGDTVSTKKTLLLENIASAASYTAVFEPYASEDARVQTWDFSDYAASSVSATANTSESYDGLTIYLNNGDKITADGIYWKNAATGAYIKNVDVLSASDDHYIVYTPTASGTLTLKFSVDCMPSKTAYQPLMCIKAASSADECNNSNGNPTVKATVANTEYTLSADLTAGTTYYIWTYSYNWSAGGYQHNYTIPSITYTYAPVYYTTTAAVAEGQEKLGTATVSADEVISGKSATFTATSVSAAYTFVNWTDANNEVVSTEATCTATIAADTTLTANFAARTESEAIETVFNFEGAFGNGNEVSATGNQNVQRGNFTFYIANGDTLTEGGVHWAGVTEGNPNSSRYILWTPSVSGTARVSFIGGATAIGGNGKPVVPSLNVKNNETGDTVGSMSADVAEQEYELEFEVAVGVTYKIYTSYFNRSTWVKITSIVIPDVVTPVTLTLAAGDANGTVAVNGVSGAGTYQVQKGEFVKLVATPDDYYGLGSWTDGDSNTLSTEETFWLYVGDAMTVTANFASESAIDITRTADFSTFAGDDGIVDQDAAWSQQVGRLEIHGAAGDTLTDSGIYWAGPGTTTSDTKKNTSGRYIKFECVKDGTLAMTFSGSATTDSRNYPRIYVTDGTSTGTACMFKADNDAHVKIYDNKKGEDVADSFTATVEAGHTYYIWPFFYHNASAHFNVTAISYAAAKSDYFPLTVTDEYGDTSVTNVYYGDSVLLDAPATTETQIFDGWVDGESASLGSGTHVRVNVAEATSAMATYRNPDAHNFVWKPSVASGDWNDAANWRYEGIIEASTYPSDASQDVVVFNTAATVSFPAAAAASNVTFNAAVTMQSDDANRYGLSAKLVDGTGAVTLANSGFANPLGSAATNNVNIVMTAGTTNHFNTVANAAWGPEITINGNISGEGCYQLNLASYSGCGIILNGDNNDFFGDIYTTGGANNRSRIWWGENAMSTNAFVHIGHSYRNDNKNDARMGGNVNVGGYDGTWFDRNDNGTITIGYLNRDSVLKIENTEWSGNGRADNVVKVGTADLELKSTIIKNLTVGEGSVTMPVGIAPQTLTIATGAKIILAGDAEWTAGTETNLFSYTTLAGTGAGTLASQVSVTGLASGLAAEISIDDNTVKATIVAVPTTTDENATIERDANTGAYTITTEAETLAITVPENVTVSEVVVSPDTATVTGVPANATLKVAVSWTDAQDVSQSAAYAIVKVDSETGAVSLDEDAVVTVGEEEIALKPQLSDAGDEVAPLDVGEKVSVGIKSIPGLVYRLARGTTPDGIDTAAAKAVAQKTATSSRVSLQDPQLPSNAAFYRVTVDVK